MSASGRRVGYQGYQSNLEDLLAQSDPPRHALIYNGGIDGDWTAWLRGRTPRFVEQHQDAEQILLMSGTNEVINGQPSGLGCAGASCDGTYAAALQAVIDVFNSAGKQVWLARSPPIFGDPVNGRYEAPAADHLKNEQIRAFNEVITKQISGYRMGPDFYRFFLGEKDRGFLFADVYHPNGLGYLLMAALWRDALAGVGELPYIAEHIEVRIAGEVMRPSYYQQNLLEAGDQYFVDSQAQLLDVPGVLQGARWIMTADAHRSAVDDDYLSVDLGTRGVDLYVAYPSRRRAMPEWLEGWQVLDKSVLTNHPDAPRLDLLLRRNVSGVTELGGAASIVSGAGSNYLVAIVPAG